MSRTLEPNGHGALPSDAGVRAPSPLASDIRTTLSAPDDACARLVLSRERLRLALQGFAAEKTRNNSASSPTWLSGLKSLPGAGLVEHAARLWWERHPWRLASQAALQTSQGLLQSIAQRHPLALVSGAVVLGGLAVWIRPWRWAAVGAARWSAPLMSQLAALLPQVLAAVVAGLAVTEVSNRQTASNPQHPPTPDAQGSQMP